jgi:hypothetical protein
MQVATVEIETKDLLNIMLVLASAGLQTICSQDRNVQPFELRKGRVTTFPTGWGRMP